MLLLPHRPDSASAHDVSIACLIPANRRARQAALRLALGGLLLFGIVTPAPGKNPAPTQHSKHPSSQLNKSSAHGKRPPRSHGAPDARNRQHQARQRLNQIHQQVQALTQAQASTAAQRSRLNQALAKQTLAVAAAASALHRTDAALSAKRHQLSQLETRRDQLQHDLNRQQQAIAELLHATYTLGQGSDLELLLGDESVARIADALVYSKYFQEDRLRRVRVLMKQLNQLRSVKMQIDAQRQALQQVRTQRASQATALNAQRANQQQLLAATNAQYQSQAQKLAALKEDEASLNRLVARLQQAIEQAAREAARAARSNPTLPAGGSANIRGNLPWPANGTVHTHGNGVLIAAAQGSEVHAVARGQVIFTGFLRGYGMLLILNHGNGWMSMYGNNEAVLHHVGDSVNAGQAVGTATAASSENTGVYFELRHNNRPVNPASWLRHQH